MRKFVTSAIKISLNGVSLTVISFTIVFLFHGVGGKHTITSNMKKYVTEYNAGISMLNENIISNRWSFLWNCFVSTISHIYQEEKHRGINDVTCDSHSDSTVYMLTPSDYLVSGFKPKLHISSFDNFYMVFTHLCSCCYKSRSVSKRNIVQNRHRQKRCFQR